MLTHLAFTNFKSWPKLNLPCRRITGLFGTNSSGKTSILQFFLVLKQTKDATDRAISLELNGNYVQLGSPRDAILDHDENLTIGFTVGWRQNERMLLKAIFENGARMVAVGHNLKLQGEVEIHRGGLRSTRLSYALEEVSFALERTAGKPTEFELTSAGATPAFAFIRTKGRPWPLPGPIRSYAFPDQARTYFQNASFLADLEVAYEAAVDRIFYLGPLREPPQRDYLWARSRPTDVGERGQKAIDAILAATAAGETRNLKHKGRLKPFQEAVAHWLREMGLIDSFAVREIAPGSNRWQAVVIPRAGGPEVLLTDVGFGISQVLPVVTLLLYVPENSTVILEQPEIHLHPLAQAGLADVIIYAAMHRGVQVIIESHSEHLLLRLQRRIAETAISADDVRLYFCDSAHGRSTLTPLKLDHLGQIENWPKDFFGDAFGETAEAERARLKRLRSKVAE